MGRSRLMRCAVGVVFLVAGLVVLAGCGGGGGGGSGVRPLPIVDPIVEPPLIVDPPQEISQLTRDQVSLRLRTSEQHDVPQPHADGSITMRSTTHTLVFPPQLKSTPRSVVPEDGAFVRAPGGKEYARFMYAEEDSHSFMRAGEMVSLTLPETVHEFTFRVADAADPDDATEAVEAVAIRLREIVAAEVEGTALAQRAPSVVGVHGSIGGRQLVKEPRDLEQERRCEETTGSLLGQEGIPCIQPEEGSIESFGQSMEGYLFEGEYAAFGIWLASAQFFFRESNDGFRDLRRQTFYYGLMTPAEDVPSSGTARYSGLAVGVFLSDAGFAGGGKGNRNVLAGDVELEVDFAARSIGGDVELHPFHHNRALDGQQGYTRIALRDGVFDANDAARFSGIAEVVESSPNGPLRQTTHLLHPTAGYLPFEMGTGEFSGMFAGPNGEEAVGRVRIGEHTGTRTGRNLEFGFLASSD